MNLATKTETWGNEDLSWLGSAHGLEMADSVTIDRTAALAVTAWATDGVVPAGAVLGKVTATGRYAPWVDAAVDGSGVAAGLLISPVMLGASGNPQGAIISHGQVIVAKLPASSGYAAGANADLPLVQFV